MTSKLKTSLLTAGLLVSVSAFTGCGSSSSTDPVVTDSKNVADGYVIDLNGTAATATCTNGNTYTSSLTVGEKGKITFSGITLDENCTITVGANAFIDTDLSGTFNSADKQIGFALKAPGDATYVSQLTTLVVDKKAKADALPAGTAKDAALAEAASLKTTVKAFDPVTAASTVSSAATSAANKLAAQKLMVLSEVLKTAMKSASSSDIADINASEFTDTTTAIVDLNVTKALPTVITNNASVKAAVEAKALTIKQVATILTSIDTTKVNVNKLVVAMSDDDKNLTTALTSSATTGVTIDETNLSNIVTSTTDSSTLSTINTAVSTINTAVTTANVAVAATPAKLTLGTTLKMGSKTITLLNGKFTTTADKDDNLTNFFAIELPYATVNKAFDEQTLTLTVTVTNKADSNDKVTLTLTYVKLDDLGSSVKITIPQGTNINISETVNNTTNTYAGRTGSDLVNTDLKFDIATIIAALGTNTVTSGITAMNNRLSASAGKSYDVEIKLTGLVQTGTTATTGLTGLTGLTADYTTITGTVTVTQ